MKYEENVGRRWTPTDSTETHSRGKLNSRIVKHKHTDVHIAPCEVDLAHYIPMRGGQGLSMALWSLRDGPWEFSFSNTQSI